MSFFPDNVGVLDRIRVSSAFTTLHSSLSRSLDLFAFRGFSIAKCGKQEFIFSLSFFGMLLLLVVRSTGQIHREYSNLDSLRGKPISEVHRRRSAIMDHPGLSARFRLFQRYNFTCNVVRQQTILHGVLRLADLFLRYLDLRS